MSREGLWSAAVQRLATTDDPAARLLIDSLIAQAPKRADAAVCAVKSILAYLAGDDVSARAAAERALRSHRGHGLAGMMLTAFEAGVNPRRLRGLLGELNA